MKTLSKMGKILSIVLTLLAGNASGQTLTNIWLFTGGIDGASPNGLVQGYDGNFYGTTRGGGTNGGYGTVFRISPAGNLTNLFSFNGTNGNSPLAALFLGSDGNFYGTTFQGGTSKNCNGGCGTTFRISPSGNFTNLHSFSGSDGMNPHAGLVQGSDGNFYGTAYGGGASTNCYEGCGTVFRISPNGNFTNLYSFSGNDGANPNAGLLQGPDGNFYGTAEYGGSNGPYGSVNGGYGTIFKISPTGTLFTLYRFDIADGIFPVGNLVFGIDGYLYGTTSQSGTNGGYGTVFKISPLDPNYGLTYLHTLPLYNDGAYPPGALVQGSDGSFYGTTSIGGTNVLDPIGGLGYGAVFSISSSGTFTHLYSFHGPDGFEPTAPLVQGSDGIFYGASSFGGYTNLNSGYGFGTLFKICVPLKPPANQISGVQITGNDMAISVPSVAGETYQLQFTTDLTAGNWSNVPNVSVTNSIGSLLTLTNFGGALLLQGFYRFDITP
jgi:uncharacterized repeat protein (TIGR03803 family)